MKITFVIQDISTQGGTERTTCCLANEFARHGHEVSIVSFFCNNGKPVYRIDEKVKTIYFNYEKYSLEIGMANRCKMAARQIRNIKTCKEIEEADVLIGQKIMASALLLFSGYGKKTIACEHYRYKMYNSIVRGVRNIMYNMMLDLVTLTDNDKRKFGKYVRSVDTIPNMVTVEPYGEPNRESKRIISAGRLTAQKGYDMLLEAVSLIKDELDGWKIDIYGEGELREELEREKKELKLEEIVTFKGFTNDIAMEYAKSSFYVMSSRFEGFPLTLIEAAGCGLPIVSFDCPEGPSTLLKNGGGILAEAENIEELSKAILTMVKDRALRERCSKECKSIIEEYSPESIYNKWINLIKRLINKQ